MITWIIIKWLDTLGKWVYNSTFILYDYRRHQTGINLNNLGPPNSDGALRFTEMTGSTGKSPLKCVTKDHTVVGSLVPFALSA